jgi:hypothetical protein
LRRRRWWYRRWRIVVCSDSDANYYTNTNPNYYTNTNSYTNANADTRPATG